MKLRTSQDLKKVYTLNDGPIRTNLSILHSCIKIIICAKFHKKYIKLLPHPHILSFLCDKSLVLGEICMGVGKIIGRL